MKRRHFRISWKSDSLHCFARVRHRNDLTLRKGDAYVLRTGLLDMWPMKQGLADRIRSSAAGVRL